MKSLRAVLFLAACSAFAVPTAAQDTTASRIPSRTPASVSAYVAEGGSADADAGRRLMFEYATCLIGSNSSGVRRVLALPLGSASMRKLYDMATSECLGGGSMTFAPALLRGALFAGLYRREFKTPSPLTEKPIDFAAEISADYAGRDQYVAQLTFADCVARADVNDSHTIVAERIDSAAEKAAYRGILPALSRCLPAGQVFQMSKPVLSGLLSEVRYREAVR